MQQIQTRPICQSSFWCIGTMKAHINMHMYMHMWHVQAKRIVHISVSTQSFKMSPWKLGRATNFVSLRGKRLMFISKPSRITSVLLRPSLLTHKLLIIWSSLISCHLCPLQFKPPNQASILSYNLVPLQFKLPNQMI